MGAKDDREGIDLNEPILSKLKEADDGCSMKLKTLRKEILLSTLEASSEDDKAAKKKFKKAIQHLEEDNIISLNKEGVVQLVVEKEKKARKKEKRKRKEKEISEEVEEEDRKSKKKKKEKKHKSTEHEASDEEERENEKNRIKKSDNDNEKGQDAPSSTPEAIPTISPEEKNKPCKGNSAGVTRLFVGNLPFAVDDTSLSEYLPGTMTHVKWITDKETGKFYGSAFVEMLRSTDAAEAVSITGSQLMGRPIKISFAPARPGDQWPPRSKNVTGGKAGNAEKGVKAMSQKPPDCKKLFIGNVSFEIDDDGIFKFFGNVDAEVKEVRWLSHKDTGDFKGCGFVEFWTTEACEKGATLNGKTLLGRPIRIDWTD